MSIYPVVFFKCLKRLAPVSLLLLAACSSGGGGDTPAATTYSIGGSISGLSGTVVLQNNGGNNLSVSANGPFTFTTKLADGAAYAVTVLTQPTGQLCTASNTTGTVAGANVTSVSVTCSAVTYTVGGNVNGLTGAGLVLKNNATDNLNISASGSFTFSTAVANGGAYSVSVGTQPNGQTCTVTNGTGTVAGANVTSVAVNCTAITYRVSVTVTGLVGSVELKNNGGDLYNVSTSGTITFPIQLPDGAAYDVTAVVVTGGQTCTVSNNTGFINGMDVIATVTCSTTTWSVGGALTGLAAGQSVVLRNNGTDDLPLNANGNFTFATRLSQGAAYDVTVATQPTNQLCTVVNGSGFNIAANITNVAVNCVNTRAINVSISSADSGGGPTLQNNGVETLVIPVINPTPTTYTFGTRIADGSPYNVTQLVRASAPVQDCSVTSGTAAGTVTGADVTIGFTCVLAVLTPQFAYVANSTADTSIPLAADTLSGFTVAGTGALTEFASGSPYATGATPQSIALLTKESSPGVFSYFAYVANFADDQIWVYSINATSGALAQIDANGGLSGIQVSITAGDGPFSLAIHPSGNFAYVVNQFANTITGYTINATGSLTGMADVSSAPGTQSTIVTGTTPYALTIDPKGRFAYVTNSADNTVSAYLINQTNGTLTPANPIAGPVTAGTFPVSVAVDSTGACALVTNNNSDNVSAYKINQTSGVLTAATGSPFAVGTLTSPRSVAIDPSGKYAYVANANTANVSGFSLDPATCVISAIDTNTAIPGDKTIAAGATPISIIVDVSGRFVYVANFASNNVSVYSIGTAGALTAVETKPTGMGPTSVAILAK